MDKETMNATNQKNLYEPGDLVFVEKSNFLQEDFWNQHAIIKKVIDNKHYGILYSCYFIDGPDWLSTAGNCLIIHESHLPTPQKQ